VAGTFPGANGRIAYAASGHIELVNPDGTGRVILNEASPASSVNEPAWNAIGTKLVFRDDSSSFSTMNADGSNVKTLVGMDSFAGNPTWSPDGSVIAFDHYIGGINQENRIYTVPATGGTASELTGLNARDPSFSPDGTKIAFEHRDAPGIGVMDATGSNAIAITTGPSGNAGDSDPSWAPNGQRLVFTRASQIWVVNADGSSVTQLTTGAEASYPTWSPDGNKIAFERDGDIWIMNVDGSNAARVTNTPGEEEREPDWGICTGANCPPQVNAPADRSLPEPTERLRVALQVKLTRPAQQPVTVQWAYRDGTATIAGGDYEAAITSGTITIPAGQTSSGDLPYSFIRGDDATEPDESYTVELSGATNAAIADARTVITILGVASDCPGYSGENGIHIVGTAGNDNLIGTDDRDVICGLGGDDTITASGSGDILDGGDGDDLVSAGSNSRLVGGPGKDSLQGQGTSNVFHGGDGDDAIRGRGSFYGGSGNDRLSALSSGSSSQDELFGQAGADRLFGGTGADSLDGGADNDRLYAGYESELIRCEGGGANGWDTIVSSLENVLKGGGGRDTADYSSIPEVEPGEPWVAREIRVEVRTDDIANDGIDGTYEACGERIEVHATDDVRADVENVLGARFLPNLIVASHRANELVGGRTGDVIVGNDGDDVLEGGGGEDRLSGQEGDDDLRGGSEDDTLIGAAGLDRFSGGPGTDRCDVSRGERGASCERPLRGLGGSLSESWLGAALRFFSP
jgi:Ca2+-binding RTX toxin-like protein